MDVSKWPHDKIMQLPDWCFGRRWWIGTYLGTVNDDVTYFKMEENLPDWFVVWQLLLTHQNDSDTCFVNLTVRLGQDVPTSATMLSFERLFRHVGTPQQFYEFTLARFITFYLTDLRVLVESKGRTIVGALKVKTGTKTLENNLAIQISSIPKEVPDWVVSGLAGVRS